MEERVVGEHAEEPALPRAGRRRTPRSASGRNASAAVRRARGRSRRRSARDRRGAPRRTGCRRRRSRAGARRPSEVGTWSVDIGPP
jgi:hypothetical protein